MPGVMLPLSSGLSPLGVARGGSHVAQSTWSLAFAAASSQYVSAPALPITDTLTIAAWIKRAGAGHWDPIMEGGNGAGGTAVLAFRNSDNVLLFAKAGVANICASTIAITDTDWHHVAATKNGADVHVYIDGVDVSGPVTNATCTPYLATLIGRDQADGFFLDGNLDFVIGLPSVLTPTQIAGLAAGMLNPLTLDYSGGGGFWPFEEGPPNTTTADASGNGNTGTLVNGVSWSTDVPSQLQ